jgi:hypothetical protein
MARYSVEFKYDMGILFVDASSPKEARRIALERMSKDLRQDVPAKAVKSVTVGGARTAMKPESGYAYIFRYEFGGPSWDKAKDDLWATEVISPKGKFVVVGTRYIDGSKVVVWHKPQGPGLRHMGEIYIAQTAVGPRFVP